MSKSLRIDAHSGAVTSGPIEIARYQSGLADHREQPLQRPDYVTRAVGNLETGLANAHCFDRISESEMVGSQTEMCGHDRRYVERSRISSVQRSGFLAARQLPGQIEVLLGFLSRSTPQVYEPCPHIESRQQHSLIQTLCSGDRTLADGECGVPLADHHSVLNRDFGGP